MPVDNMTHDHGGFVSISQCNYTPTKLLTYRGGRREHWTCGIAVVYVVLSSSLGIEKRGQPIPEKQVSGKAT